MQFPLFKLDQNVPHNIVPAFAGTHNHERLLLQKPLAAFPKTRGRGVPEQLAPRRRYDASETSNLYSITTNQAAIIALFRVLNRYVRNLPP